ncbi:MAG: hypothetical protein DWQ35_16070 [Planctomycetota bacterium]|nr:MAG: hypothetical protein DWQ35_16070 [Planctomycetota bacterium]REK18251.1 MAG: hypothetical protein DWQ42_20445 [Planctomycetota bacterium]REK49121.1 MAG: hypothetical protein DWQ46_01045 [Planctomycetota bacterium]
MHATSTHSPKQHQIDAATGLSERYKLLTAATLCQLRSDLFSNALSAESVLKQLSRDGILRESSLYRNRSCFHAVSSNPEQEDLSEMAKIRSYAMLAVCASKTASRTKLTQKELHQYFSDVYRSGLALNYYIDFAPSDPVLGFLRVDTGGAARWDRIVAKAQSDVRKHRLDPSFERFLKRRAFEVRIVTALPQKADRVRRALIDKPSPGGVPIHVSIVPELINLIAPLPS